MIKEIKIFSEWEAKEKVPHMGDIALISIVDKGAKSIEWPSNVKELFSMKFDDTDNSIIDASPKERSFKGLKEFIDNVTSETIVVHCYAGISRSSAVAAALGEYLNIKQKIWTNKRYDPNLLVYELTKQELFNGNLV